MGAVYSSLDLVCCDPAGKGLLEVMPDLSLPDLLGVTEGPGAKEPSKLVQWVEEGGQEGRQKTHLDCGSGSSPCVFLFLCVLFRSLPGLFSLSVLPLGWALGFCIYVQKEAVVLAGCPAGPILGSDWSPSWLWSPSQSEPSVGSVILGRCGQIQGASHEPLTPHLGTSPPAPRQALPWALDQKPWPRLAWVEVRVLLGPQRPIDGL